MTITIKIMMTASSFFSFLVFQLFLVEAYSISERIQLHEDDLILTESQKKFLEKTENEEQSIDKLYNQWTDGVVNYYFDVGTETKRKRDAVEMAMRNISSKTCISFVENSTAQNRIKIVDGNGCSSHLGMIGGEQNLNIGACENTPSIIHKLMHSLGIIHTQSRVDRDSFLKVDMNQISSSIRKDYEIVEDHSYDDLIPYEYGSIMHFKTIPQIFEPKNADYYYTLGNRRLTFYDIQLINKIYKCSCPGDVNPCEKGGYPNPAQCKLCNCPDGFAGRRKCQDNDRPRNLYTVQLLAERNWTSDDFLFGFDPTLKHNSYLTFVWIFAPKNETIEVELQKLENVTCELGCVTNGIEIKTHKDRRLVNPIVCCDNTELFKRTFRSNDSPLMIVLYGDNPDSIVYLKYRCVP